MSYDRLSHDLDISTFSEMQLFTRITDDRLERPHDRQDLLNESDFLMNLHIPDRKNEREVIKDPSYYDIKLLINGVKHETEKSYLIDFKKNVSEVDINLWVPKKIIRKLGDGYVVCHAPILSKIMETFMESKGFTFDNENGYTNI